MEKQKNNKNNKNNKNTWKKFTAKLVAFFASIGLASYSGGKLLEAGKDAVEANKEKIAASDNLERAEKEIKETQKSFAEKLELDQELNKVKLNDIKQAFCDRYNQNNPEKTDLNSQEIQIFEKYLDTEKLIVVRHSSSSSKKEYIEVCNSLGENVDTSEIRALGLDENRNNNTTLGQKTDTSVAISEVFQDYNKMNEAFENNTENYSIIRDKLRNKLDNYNKDTINQKYKVNSNEKNQERIEKKDIQKDDDYEIE